MQGHLMLRRLVPPAPKKAFSLRMPAALHERLYKAAVANGHSLNAEIEQRLERSYASQSR
jgi:predicted HicB family RNase H-like nuclease